MTPVGMMIVGPALATVLTVSICSAQSGRRGPQPRHGLRDRETAATGHMPVRHRYRCDADRTLVADFLDDGLTVELHRDAKSPAIVMTALMRWRLYVGDAATMTFAGDRMRIETPDEPPVSCRTMTR